MNVRPFRAIASCASVGLALALAGCAGGPGAPLGSNVSPPSGPPKFVQTNGANVAFAEFKNSAFPYRGLIPADEDHDKARPFLDVNDGGRLGHSSPRGGLLWEDATYNDRHVLLGRGERIRSQPPGHARGILPWQPGDLGARRRRTPANGSPARAIRPQRRARRAATRGRRGGLERRQFLATRRFRAIPRRGRGQARRPLSQRLARRVPAHAGRHRRL